MLILPPSSVESFLGYFLEMFPLWEPGSPIQLVLKSWDSTIQILKIKTIRVSLRIHSPTSNSWAVDLCSVATLDIASCVRHRLSVCPVRQTVPRAFAGDWLYWINGRRSWGSITKILSQLMIFSDLRLVALNQPWWEYLYLESWQLRL